MSVINDLSDGIGNTVKIIPNIYEDGLKQTIKESGKALSLIPQTINAVLAPLKKWIAQKEYNIAKTEKLLALKLEKVGSESIVSPEAYIAVPALQAISYCENSEELRNMYANLLATSMLKDKKDKAHPSFVEIIKQLSPDEAKLLKKISETGDLFFPLIDVKLYTKEGGFIPKVHNFTLLAEGVCDKPWNKYAYIDNLERLKIINIPFGTWITNDDFYKEIESCKEIQDLIKTSVPEGCSWKIERKEFDVTQYGKSFIETCVKGVE